MVDARDNRDPELIGAELLYAKRGRSRVPLSRIQDELDLTDIPAAETPEALERKSSWNGHLAAIRRHQARLSRIKP